MNTLNKHTMANPLLLLLYGGGIMLGGELWLDDFLESLTDEELENLIEEIQEKLRRRARKTKRTETEKDTINHIFSFLFD